jgi:hypothetical protein
MGKLLKIAIVGSIIAGIVYGWRRLMGNDDFDEDFEDEPAAVSGAERS